MEEVIVVVGLGYVGLPLAVEFAKTRRVIGFDISEEKIAELESGVDRTGEIGSSELAGVSANLEISCNPAVLQFGSYFIVTVPTPVTEANQPDFSPLLSACHLVGPHLTPGDVVIFESTVYPGCTEEICIPILEQESGIKCDLDGANTETFSVGYSPERINPGDKVHRLSNIIKLVSGSSLSASSKVKDLYDSIISAGTYLCPSIKVAEAAKVIENTQRDINIAFVNELAQICDRLNISSLDVLNAARTKWNFLDFRPGLVGGHCIGVDPYYLAYGAQKVGHNAGMVLSGRSINNEMSGFLVKKILMALSHQGVAICNARVAVLGLTFKENCPDFRNSKAVALVNELSEWGVKVFGVDPYVTGNAEPLFRNVTLSSLKDLVSLHLIVCLVAHDQFSLLEVADLKKMGCLNNELLVFDLKGCLKANCANDDQLKFITF